MHVPRDSDVLFNVIVGHPSCVCSVLSVSCVKSVNVAILLAVMEDLPQGHYIGNLKINRRVMPIKTSHEEC